MTLSQRALSGIRTRADRVRTRRARVVRKLEPIPRERQVKRRSKRKPRRRYDLQLSAERGAEAQLPAVPVIHTGPRLFSVILLIATFWALRYCFSSSKFQVDQTRVINNVMLTTAQVRSIVPLVGQSIFTIDPEVIEARLTEQAEVFSAVVSLTWPNQVEIRLVERFPVVEWNDAGRVWWISSDGLAFIPHGSRPGMVRIEAVEPFLRVSEEELEPVVSTDLIQALIDLTIQLPEVETLQFDPLHGLGFDDPRGWRVNFGFDGDMSIKVKLFRSIAGRLSEEDVPAVLINIEDQHAPFYRVER